TGTWLSNVQFCSAFPTSCRAFEQISIDAAGHGVVAAVNVTDFLIATLTFTVVSANVNHVDFAWRTTPSAARLDFFGVTNAPGYSVTIVPEPATAVLIAVGLFGVVVITRRHRRPAR